MTYEVSSGSTVQAMYAFRLHKLRGVRHETSDAPCGSRVQKYAMSSNSYHCRHKFGRCTSENFRIGFFTIPASRTPRCRCKTCCPACSRIRCHRGARVFGGDLRAGRTGDECIPPTLSAHGRCTAPGYTSQDVGSLLRCLCTGIRKAYTNSTYCQHKVGRHQ